MGTILCWQFAAAIVLLPLNAADIQSLVDASKKAFNEGRYAAAETSGRQALEMAERDDQSQIALCLNNLAAAESAEGKYREAEQLNRRALRLWQNTPNQEIQAAVTLGNLGVALGSEANFAEAEAAEKQS